MNQPLIIDFCDFETKDDICSLLLKYNLTLTELIPQLKSRIKEDFCIVNEFKQPIPLTYRIRSSLKLFIRTFS